VSGAVSYPRVNSWACRWTPALRAPTRKPHAPSFLRRGFLRWLSARESERRVPRPRLRGWLTDSPSIRGLLPLMDVCYRSSRSQIKLTRFLPRLKPWASALSPLVNDGASHAHGKGDLFGTSGVRSDEPMGVPRPRYSYSAWDSEVPDCFVSGCCPRAYLFDGADTESTASLWTAEAQRATVASTTEYVPVGHSNLSIRAVDRMKTPLYPRPERRGFGGCY